MQSLVLIYFPEKELFKGMQSSLSVKQYGSFSVIFWQCSFIRQYGLPQQRLAD